MSLSAPVAVPNPQRVSATLPAQLPIVRLRGLSKSYEEAGRQHTVLHAIDADIFTGDVVVLLGKSGSGKSTLLNLIGGIDVPSSGEVWIDGHNLTRMSERELTLFRRDQIGFVFQFFNLIPTLTALENISLPFELRGKSRREGERRARALLDRVELAPRANTFPDRLSGGEQQRVAIARALVHEPALILADEPTGNLDEETGNTVLRLLLELTRDAGKTLIMATHNADVVAHADVCYHIHEGKLVSDAPDRGK
jgi:putative ABC transport system ATP-binding protein